MAGRKPANHPGSALPSRGPGRILPRRAGGSRRRLGLRGRAALWRGGEGVPGRVFTVPAPSWRPWPGFPGLRPPPVHTSVEAIGVVARPLVPAATGHRCPRVLPPFRHQGPQGGVSWPTRGASGLVCRPVHPGPPAVVLPAPHLRSGDPHAFLGVTCVQKPGAVALAQL